MVKKPEPAPESGPTREAIDLLLERASNPEIHGLFQRANREYVYWDKFKQLTMPGVDPITAWTALKLNRRMGARYVPIHSLDGPPFWYTLTDELQRSLMVIERQGGGWVGTTARDVSRDARKTYLLRQLMEEAIASSQIEGAATTRRAAKEMLRTGREPETRGERMILNNYRTIGRIRELSRQPLTPQLLLDLQASLTAGTLNDASEVGRFRNDADDDIVVGDNAGQVLYVPPPARMLQDQLQALCYGLIKTPMMNSCTRCSKPPCCISGWPTSIHSAMVMAALPEPSSTSTLCSMGTGSLSMCPSRV